VTESVIRRVRTSVVRRDGRESAIVRTKVSSQI
jgi:hypothetical protein